MTTQKLAYTFAEAALQCGFSVRTIESQMAAGKLIARHANGEAVIRHEDLADWLDHLPAEPKGGHPRVRTLNEDENVLKNVETLGDGYSVTDSDGKPEPKPMFRTPEVVAPELGMSRTELRRYCRESGINTRLSSNRIMLSADDVEKIIEWVRNRPPTPTKWAEESGVGYDPFA